MKSQDIPEPEERTKMSESAEVAYMFGLFIALLGVDLFTDGNMAGYVSFAVLGMLLLKLL
jgi:hypothetical protein